VSEWEEGKKLDAVDRDEGLVMRDVMNVNVLLFYRGRKKKKGTNGGIC